MPFGKGRVHSFVCQACIKALHSVALSTYRCVTSPRMSSVISLLNKTMKTAGYPYDILLAPYIGVIISRT